ncbi:Hypothetical protein R9X50_00528300 [Acrodontium crateriforme]|uniref:Uncharacterized protein n=1 Tax=Acrodontium crateriforme TaxID=150365 RepID=A0AAQ3M678_9PEZI|nr:Hypothetical protein R9X50_00528300 [Acrodontium crateriforme]
MSFNAGGLAQMTYNNNNNGFPSGAIGAPGAGFGGRSRLNAKRLSVALPPKVAPIDEDQVESPAPRTSRSHLLAGLRTQPKTPSVPASAPYNQTQHQVQGLNASKWADASYNNGYGQGVPQTATGAHFDVNRQYAANAGRQMYSLPEQVLAPPSMYEQAEEMDPSVLQQMQMTSMFLAQRQQQLQQQLANITAAAQGMNLNGQPQRHSFQMPIQHAFAQPQVQSPMEVPGQPGVYLVFNPNTQSYNYVVDQAVQQQAQMNMSPVNSAGPFSPPTPSFNVTPPANDNMRSFIPPKKAPSPPTAVEHVEPLPPPSATAFRRGHKKASSLFINPMGNTAEGPKTSSAATFGSQRAAFPPTPMTGTFGPGAARAGEHPARQPRGPPPLEELVSAPTSQHEGSKNFATRQRRRALDSLMKAGTQRRGVSRSSGGSPVSEREYNFSLNDEAEELTSIGSSESRKMSPIGSEMKEKRASQGSNDGYFGFSSASSSEAEDYGAFKQPPTPATPIGAGGDRKKMMLGVLSAAEKRKSFAM